MVRFAKNNGERVMEIIVGMVNADKSTNHLVYQLHHTNLYFSKMNRFIRLLFASILLSTAASGFGKAFPKGILDLPGSISIAKPIGALADHPWENSNVSGVRIRTGWDNSELSDGVYNWAQIDESLALAAQTGKFIGLGVTTGLTAPPWLMGGETFVDGTTVEGDSTLTSLTANFTADDIGRVIVAAYFPTGTTIVSRTSSTVVTTSATATKSTTIKKPLTFSVLARDPGGAAFRVLTAPDEGVMLVPWDPVAKEKWKRFVVNMGERYDSNPQLQYVVMTGFQGAGECYLAKTAEDVAFFDASAVAAGYQATDDLPAGLVAWEATVKEIVAQYMESFPNTPLLITGARPYGGDFQSQGQDAMNDIFAWGVAAYPGRFGVMNSQLHVGSSPGYFLNAAIVANANSIPTGIQFLCAGTSNNPDNLPRLCDASPWGILPLLSIHDAVNSACAAGVSLGLGFIEVYEDDIENPDLQEILAAQKAALLQGASAPQPPTNLRIVP
jgi:hypothetical protein